jgi:hypothetical protein
MEVSMDIRVHAQLMSQMCAPRFAALILQAPDRFDDQRDRTRKI